MILVGSIFVVVDLFDTCFLQSENAAKHGGR